ncbi:hypothetical protein B0H11DRAFT_2183125 [Mycena galericulata]|nr:hypothetical protein B0H11DRAFT_2183125 [Mycena galericulata]
MYPSTRKDRCLAIGIHGAPSHISKAEFETKMKGLASALLAVPIARKNYLRFDIVGSYLLVAFHISDVAQVLQNDVLDPFLRAQGWPEPPPAVVFIVETEVLHVSLVPHTYEHLAQILSDPEYQRVVAGAAEFRFHTGACSFSATLLSKMDRSGPRDRNYIFWIYKVPRHVSTEEFQKQLEGFVDEILPLPACQKAILNHTIAVPNDTMDTHINALGLSAPQATFVVQLQGENWDRLIELLKDPEVLNVVDSNNKQFYFDRESCCFSADVLSMVETE